MPESKKTIVLVGKIVKGKIVDELLFLGELSKARVSYDEALGLLGTKYAYVELHNLSRMTRRAHKESV